MRLGDDRRLGRGEPDAMIGTLVGPFTIVRRLGEGGMGKVYLAEHTVLKTQRAVKFLSPHLTQNALLVARFVNEARAAARLDHRNLIAVHDVGQLPSGAWFMVLDYLDGDTLGRFIQTHAGPIPPQVVVHIIREIANGLQVAHDHEIVHRDLKPDNVFLIIRDGHLHHAVVLDFGVAQLGDDAAGPRTRSGVVIGTPAYMSPEQLRGARVGPAADIFALGVIAYQMSTGGWFPYQHAESRARFCELAAVELYHRQMTGPPIDPRDRCGRLGGTWAAAVLAAVCADPARRPDSVRAFVLSLVAALPTVGRGPERPTMRLPPGSDLAAAGAELPPLDLPRPPRRYPITADAGSRYQVGDQLGCGGMAEVFAGTMVGVEGFARPVAIKRVLSGLSQVPAFATMFVAEARIASRLAHPNIVSVLDFSRDVEDRLFLVMEYVEGKDLASLIDAGPIQPSLAIFIVVELLRGLGYAHDLPDPVNGTRGVIHRDVSPQNLLLSYEGAVKLSDFGLAKARAASEGVCSVTVRGKPSYMSPEQISGELLDGRTDLYSVGVILWELLAQRPLFAGTTREIMGQVMFRDIAAPSRIRGGVPPDVEAVAMTMLARDRDDRYPTAELAIEALLRCDDVPRDGRGELVHLLAERFPRASGVRSQRPSGPPRTSDAHGGARVAAVPRAPRVEQVTVSAPPSVTPTVASAWIPAVARPSRTTVVATLSGIVFGSLAATVIARSDVAPSGAPDPAALSAQPPSALPAAPEPPVPPDQRDRVTRTGELVITVKPSATIWLNGELRGPTPFRARVPAGGYDVRLANDELGRSETATVTVEPGSIVTIEKSW